MTEPEQVGLFVEETANALNAFHQSIGNHTTLINSLIVWNFLLTGFIVLQWVQRRQFEREPDSGFKVESN